ncbi:MAG: 30S ribosomal protein S6 [Patescibacteria group bacterium]
MKLYEIYVVLKPSLNEDALNKFTSEITEALAQSGFGISATKIKLNERLPYLIKGFGEGHTLDLEISGPEEAVLPQTVMAGLRHNENVLRHLALAKSEKMLKKIKPWPSFEPRPFRPERKPLAVGESLAPTEPKTESVKVDIAEVDKKLEELLK